MPRSRLLLTFCMFAFASGLLASASAATAGTFAQSWAVSGWNMAGEIGSSDADIQPEILFTHAADGHFAIFDELHGTMEKEFPAYGNTNASFGAGADIDGDGRTDLVIQSNPGVLPPFFRIYRWNGSDYVPFIAHSEPVAFYGLSPFRTAGNAELWEVSADPSTPPSDFRLRDLSGSVLFRASTDVPGWSGPFRQSSWIDRDGDGISELVLEDQASVRMFNEYAGGLSVAWTLPGWESAIEIGNLDDDAQSELLVVSSADARYAIVDAVSGALQQEFPAFVFPETVVQFQDVDNDGRPELVARKSVSGQPPVLSIHRWNGAILAPFASVTATHEFSNMAVSSLRGPTQVEVLEMSPTDLLVRELAGTLLFRASTNIPGWSVAPFSFDFTSSDADGDGFPEMILHDPSHVWTVHYGGTFTLSWTANGWRWFQGLGNMDADSRPEFMFTSSADNRFAMFDGLTGTSQQDFPAFTSNNSTYTTLDVDSDGQTELFFGRLPGETPLFTGYHWNGASFVPTYSHVEPIGSWTPVQLRSDSQFEILETDNTDIRVRDLNATVLFRASTDLPDWVGNPGVFAGPATNFPQQFGPRALFILEQARTRFVLSHATTAVPGAPGATAFRLFQNAPNPFRSSTAFRMVNPRAGEVGIRIFDAAGRLVRRLDRRLPAGENEIRWDGRDDWGRSVPSGVLFYEVTADGIRQTKKLIRTD